MVLRYRATATVARRQQRLGQVAALLVQQCGTDAVCAQGMCMACGENGERCCSGNRCEAGLACPTSTASSLVTEAALVFALAILSQTPSWRVCCCA